MIFLDKITVPRLFFAKITEAEGSSSEQKSKPRILVVDDERDITAIFRSALERNGFEVDVFNKPEDAYSGFNPGCYDLMILDVRMPGISGFELYEKLAKVDSKPRVCFMTAYDNFETEFLSRFPNLKLDCVIRKPLSIPNLIKTVRDELGRAG